MKMKILFISLGDQPDYQCDVIYHGLKSLFGKQIEALNNMWYMYDDIVHTEKKHLYGLGFSLYGLLPSSIKNVPPIEEITDKVISGYYKYVIYGSAQKELPLLNLVKAYYKKANVIFIDGEDTQIIKTDLKKIGLYFKRELAKKEIDVFPINFGIPEEKITAFRPIKTKEFSYNFPGKLHTYIFQDEQNYYEDYRSSRYAITFKKAGWDCLRHYEIIACGTLPIFTDIDDCPSDTMTMLPKDLLKEINNRFKGGNLYSIAEYDEMTNSVLKFCREHLTTTAVANYMIKTIDQAKSLEDEYFTKKALKDETLSIDTKTDYLRQFISTKNVKQIGYLGDGTCNTVKNLSLGNNSKIYFKDTFSSINNSLVKCSPALQLLDEEVSSLDYVVLDGVLTSSSNITQTLIRTRCLLKKNGYSTIIVPNFYTVWRLISIVRHRFSFYKTNLSITPPINFFSEKSLKSSLLLHGFSIIEVRHQGMEANNKFKMALNKLHFFRKFTSTDLYISVIKNDD